MWSGQKQHHASVLEMLAISWQRTPSPGLTGKGGRNLRASQSARVGEGFPSDSMCKRQAAAICWPLQLKAQNL